MEGGSLSQGGEPAEIFDVAGVVLKKNTKLVAQGYRFGEDRTQEENWKSVTPGLWV